MPEDQTHEAEEVITPPEDRGPLEDSTAMHHKKPSPENKPRGHKIGGICEEMCVTRCGR